MVAEMQDGAAALAPGTKIADFPIQRVLGRPGRFGVTYLAHAPGTVDDVAIKEFLPTEFARRDGRGVAPRTAADERPFRWGVRCFLDEARALAQLSNPNAVKVRKVLETNGTAYSVMDYVAGESLAQRLQREPAPDAAGLRRILLALAQGVEALHTAGILHRDITSDNVILRGSEPVLIDFGAARNAMGSKQPAPYGTVFTSGYAPVELYSRSGRQGPWTDLYELGAVAYHAITGQPPPDATARAQGQALMPPAAQAGAERLPAPLLAAIDWALRLAPEDRPQSVAEWVEALEGRRAVPEAAAGAPAVVVPLHQATAAREIERPRAEPPLVPVVAQAAPNRAPLWLGAAIATAAVLGAGYWWHASKTLHPTRIAAPAASASQAAAAPAGPQETTTGPSGAASGNGAVPAAGEAKSSDTGELTLDRLAMELLAKEQQAAAQARQEEEAKKRAEVEAAAREQALAAQRRQEEQQAALRRQQEEEAAKKRAEEEARRAQETQQANAAAPKEAQRPAPSEPKTQTARGNCSMHASDLSPSGKLTFNDIARMHGITRTGPDALLTPPIRLPDGREVIFEVTSDDCVRISRLISAR